MWLSCLLWLSSRLSSHQIGTNPRHLWPILHLFRRRATNLWTKSQKSINQREVSHWWHGQINPTAFNWCRCRQRATSSEFAHNGAQWSKSERVTDGIQSEKLLWSWLSLPSMVKCYHCKCDQSWLCWRVPTSETSWEFPDSRRLVQSLCSSRNIQFRRAFLL